MSYLMYDDITEYDPRGRHITIGDHVHSGMFIRFSYPDYSYEGKQCVDKLVLNKLYRVTDYTPYMGGINLLLDSFPGINFDSRLFTHQNNNYMIPYGRRKIKFWWEKNKRKFIKCITGKSVC